MLCAAFTLRWREGGEGGESHVTCMRMCMCMCMSRARAVRMEIMIASWVPSSSFVLRGREGRAVSW